jgi:hypothetical protein
MVSSRLDNFYIVGEAKAKYYNIKHKCYKICGNVNTASLCQTAFRSDLLTTFYTCCLKRDSSFIDSRLWNKSTLGKKCVFQDGRALCVGIKGMPGRNGIGMGHRMGGKKKHYTMQVDSTWQILKKWIGESDAQFYIDLYAKVYS